MWWYIFFQAREVLSWLNFDISFQNHRCINRLARKNSDVLNLEKGLEESNSCGSLLTDYLLSPGSLLQLSVVENVIYKIVCRIEHTDLIMIMYFAILQCITSEVIYFCTIKKKTNHTAGYHGPQPYRFAEISSPRHHV